MSQPEFQNVLLYAFSTLSQTLAGFAGLLAAIILVRLSGLDKLIEYQVGMIKGRVEMDSLRSPNCNEVQNAVRSQWEEGEFEKAVGYAEENPGKFNKDAPEFVARGRRLLDLRGRVVGKFWTALAFTVVAIALSLLVLSFAPLIAKCSCFAWMVIAAGLCMAFACLYSYWKLIKSALAS